MKKTYAPTLIVGLLIIITISLIDANIQQNTAHSWHWSSIDTISVICLTGLSLWPWIMNWLKPKSDK